eukprot:COSAG02_NODE_1727_length_11182_cov_40.189209_8_plen_333_part_00
MVPAVIGQEAVTQFAGYEGTPVARHAVDLDHVAQSHHLNSSSALASSSDSSCQCKCCTGNYCTPTYVGDGTSKEDCASKYPECATCGSSGASGSCTASCGGGGEVCPRKVCNLRGSCSASNACEAYRDFLACVLEAGSCDRFEPYCTEAIAQCPNWQACGCSCDMKLAGTGSCATLTGAHVTCDQCGESSDTKLVINLLIVFAVAVAAAVGGYYIYQKRQKRIEGALLAHPAPQPTAGAPSTQLTDKQAQLYGQYAQQQGGHNQQMMYGQMAPPQPAMQVTQTSINNSNRGSLIGCGSVCCLVFGGIMVFSVYAQCHKEVCVLGQCATEWTC